MTIASNAKTRLFVAASTTSVSTLVAFEALTWVEIKNVEDAGSFGDKADEISVEFLGDARKRRFKGARDAGSMKIKVGFDAVDAGQVILRAAVSDDFNRPFKVVLNDAPAADGTGSEFYFSALVMGAEVELGQSKNVVTQSFDVAISSDVLNVAPAA